MDKRIICSNDDNVQIDLREVLKSMAEIDNFSLHSGKEVLLKFNIDNLPKNTCELLLDYGMKINNVPAVIMTGGFRFIKKGQKHIQVYLDATSKNDLVSSGLYVPIGFKDIDVCLIDDVVTTGKAMEEANKILDNNGFKVVRKICLLNRGNYDCESLINKEQMLEWLGL